MQLFVNFSLKVLKFLNFFNGLALVSYSKLLIKIENNHRDSFRRKIAERRRQKTEPEKRRKREKKKKKSKTKKAKRRRKSSSSSGESSGEEKEDDEGLEFCICFGFFLFDQTLLGY